MCFEIVRIRNKLPVMLMCAFCGRKVKRKEFQNTALVSQTDRKICFHPKSVLGRIFIIIPAETLIFWQFSVILSCNYLLVVVAGRFCCNLLCGAGPLFAVATSSGLVPIFDPTD